MAKQLNQIFYEIATLAIRKKAAPINKLPGCWEIDVGPWKLTVNGQVCSVKNSLGDKVPAFSALIYRVGWLRFMVDPQDGVRIGGSSDEEDEIITALKAA